MHQIFHFPQHPQWFYISVRRDRVCSGCKVPRPDRPQDQHRPFCLLQEGVRRGEQPGMKETTDRIASLQTWEPYQMSYLIHALCQSMSHKMGYLHWKLRGSYGGKVSKIYRGGQGHSALTAFTAWCKKIFPLFEIPASFLPSKMASPCTANWP